MFHGCSPMLLLLWKLVLSWAFGLDSWEISFVWLFWWAGWFKQWWWLRSMKGGWKRQYPHSGFLSQWWTHQRGCFQISFRGKGDERGDKEGSITRDIQRDIRQPMISDKGKRGKGWSQQWDYFSWLQVQEDLNLIQGLSGRDNIGDMKMPPLKRFSQNRAR